LKRFSCTYFRPRLFMSLPRREVNCYYLLSGFELSERVFSEMECFRD
jgi:hypothetical protein